MTGFDKARHVAQCLQMAILLEVTASKPGNVNPTIGFQGTRVEHFLASAVAATPSLAEAAKRGIAVADRNIEISSVGMGQLMKECVTDISVWQKGGNTLLGTVMLFIPIAVAAGMTPVGRKGEFDLSKLRMNLKLAVESTTPKDAVDLYDAIALANPSGLGDAPDLSVSNVESKARLIRENVSLYQVFKIAAGYDDICYEWINNFPISFDLAYPFLMEELESKSLNTAIIHVFLKILSERPDTFIARKAGLTKAQEISREAKKILDSSSTETSAGKEALSQFDRKLREHGNSYNPGTTADLTAATLALCTLSGYRP